MKPKHLGGPPMTLLVSALTVEGPLSGANRIYCADPIRANVRIDLDIPRRMLAGQLVVANGANTGSPSGLTRARWAMMAPHVANGSANRSAAAMASLPWS